MATHRRLARESQRCRGAFKAPFHRQLLEGNARDEWISALLWVGGLDRRHSALASTCVSLSVWVFVYLHVSATLSKAPRFYHMMAQDCHHAAVQHRHHCVGEPPHEPEALPLFSMWCSAAVPQSLPHLMCFESSSMVSQTAAWSLHWWLLSLSKCVVIAMYSHHYIVLAIGLTVS